ncbi:MAG: hypothetical protein C4576_03935 [Desulfobacteraceae bacterium]|nr:MAG: hypothetical protein C4576_03935 [Desulfobacteraceae bacterium]
MQTPEHLSDAYAKCVAGSKRIRWDIEKDVLRGRQFDFTKKFLPDGISKVNEMDFLENGEKVLLSQIQGRTYANMFGFVERFITAKILEISRDHWLGDQIALEALIRFCDEEIKHQDMFRRIEGMMAGGMSGGYSFPWNPNEVAGAVLGKSTWAVMGLIYEIELFTQEHYKQSIEPDQDLSELYKDVFLYHWKEEAHHAVLDGLEWPRQHDKLTTDQRDHAVNELIELVGDVDGILKVQSKADADFFLEVSPGTHSEEHKESLRKSLLRAYRWQYIFSGVEHPRFQKLLGELTDDDQKQRIRKALAPLLEV